MLIQLAIMITHTNITINDTTNNTINDNNRNDTTTTTTTTNYNNTIDITNIL